MLQLIQVGLEYAKHQPILQAVCLELAAGQRLAVCGLSGAGKSTLLRLIAGLTTPTTGRIFIDGRDVTDDPPAMRGIAWIPQRPTLWPGLSVAENLAMTLRVLPRRQRPSPAAIAQRVRLAAEAFGLVELLGRPCEQLSGGQAQRVALARVLVRPARLWLLDEPLTSLDPPLRWQVARQLLLQREQIAATMIVVTHDWAEAANLAERVAIVSDRTLTPPTVVEQLRVYPQSLHQARLVGEPPWNLLDGELVNHPNGCRVWLTAARLWIALGRRIGLRDGSVVLGVRPESLRLSQAHSGQLDWGSWQLTRITQRGGVAWLHLTRESAELVVLADAQTQSVGSLLYRSLEVSCSAESIRLFCPKTEKTLLSEV